MPLFRRFWYYVSQKIRPFFDVDMNGKKISGLPVSGYPIVDGEAATKKYVDDKIDGDMLKATYDIDEDGIVGNSEKLEGSSKAQVQDHSVKVHALGAHTAPSSDVNMGGKKIVTLANPVTDQDIATKKYADDLLGTVTPADVSIMPWPWTPGSSEATIRSQYSTLLSLGINSFLSQYHYDNYQNGDGYVDWYVRIYTLAEEYGIKVYWYSAGHRMDFVNQVTEKYPVAKYFVERFGAFPACGGWFMIDEPSAHLYPWADMKVLYDKATFQDPIHPKFSVWVVAVHDNWHDRYIYTCHPSSSQTWCMIEDVCSIDCYPWYSGHEIGWLEYYVIRDYSNHHGDAPGDCPKLMIPCMQAWMRSYHDDGSPVGNRMPDDGIVQQYNVWEATYGYSGFEAIGLYQAGGQLFASGDDAENIRNQIKALARLRGWGG